MADFIGIQKWLETELIEYEPEVIKEVHPEKWGYEGRLLTTTADLRLGLRKIVHARMDMTGRAVNYGGKATSVPLANFGITMEEDTTAVGILAAEWSYFDLEAERTAARFPELLQGRDLVRNFRDALDLGLRDWMHLKHVFGDRELNMSGLLTDADVTVINEAQNLNTMPTGDLDNWWLARVAEFKKRNRLTAEATSVVMSVDLETSMNRRFGDGGSDGTPMKMLRERVSTIDVVNELSASYLEEFGVLASGSNKDMLLVYQNNRKVIDRKYYPIEVTTPALLDDQLTYRIIGFCATSEVRVKQPMKVEYITYPKAT